MALGRYCPHQRWMFIDTYEEGRKNHFIQVAAQKDMEMLLEQNLS